MARPKSSQPVFPTTINLFPDSQDQIAKIACYGHLIGLPKGDRSSSRAVREALRYAAEQIDKRAGAANGAN